MISASCRPLRTDCRLPMKRPANLSSLRRPPSRCHNVKPKPHATVATLMALQTHEVSHLPDPTGTERRRRTSTREALAHCHAANLTQTENEESSQPAT
eukprot:6509965-Pyramimonas_sp.AAC.1